MPGPTTTANLAASLQEYFSRDLLMRMIPTLVYAEFAMKSPLPAKSGSTSIRMFRFDAPRWTDVRGAGTTPALQEGIPIDRAQYRQLNLEYVDVQLEQYVQVVSISDVADASSLFDLVGQANVQNAEDAALHCDTLTQFELAISTGSSGQVDYTKKKYLYGGAATGYPGVENGGVADPTLVMAATDVLDGATALKVNKAPKINGAYVLAAPPQVTRDLMAGAPADTIWLHAAQYSAVQQLFNGEVGKLYGVRVVEHNNAYTSATTPPGADPQANYDPDGNVYSSFMFGRQAYGLPNIAQLGSPYSPSVFVVSGASKSDPANQIRALVSWKAFWAAKVLQPYWLVHLFTQSGAV